LPYRSNKLVAFFNWADGAFDGICALCGHGGHVTVEKNRERVVLAPMALRTCLVLIGTARVAGLVAGRHHTLSPHVFCHPT